MQKANKIFIRDKQSQEVLKSFELSDSEAAYREAMHLEQMGLDIDLDIPSLPASFAMALGHQGRELEDYQQSLAKEIEDHDGSCCVRTPSA